MKIQHVTVIKNINMRKQVRQILEMCDEDFVPSLSQRRRKNDGQTKKELMDIYLAEKDRTREYLVATENGEVVGFINFVPNTPGSFHFPPNIGVDTICVHPRHRGKGIGDALYRHLEEQYETKQEWLVLSTWSTNKAQKHLLKRRGYTLLSVIKNGRRTGIDTEIYYKRIHCKS